MSRVSTGTYIPPGCIHGKQCSESRTPKRFLVSAVILAINRSTPLPPLLKYIAFLPSLSSSSSLSPPLALTILPRQMIERRLCTSFKSFPLLLTIINSVVSRRRYSPARDLTNSRTFARMIDLRRRRQGRAYFCYARYSTSLRFLPY